MADIDINEELRNYAIKVATGRSSIGDESRVHQIGLALSREVTVPPAPAPAEPTLPPSPPEANGRKGMGKVKK